VQPLPPSEHTYFLKALSENAIILNSITILAVLQLFLEKSLIYLTFL